MAYKELRKLYYGDTAAYKKEYMSRFQSEDAIHLDFYISENQAFFLEDASVLRLAYDIERINRDIDGLSRQLPGVAKGQYSQKCLIDEIVLTNKIEGVHSSRKEIDDALMVLESQSEKCGKKHRFLGLVNKYLKLTQREVISLSTCQDIRDIYDELFLQEVVAENPENTPDGTIFRKHSTSVYGSADKVIHTGLMPEAKIIEAVQKALAFLNDKSIDYIFRVAVFHYLLEYIHPFYDGNGRLSRFIVSYCIAEVYEPLLAYRISETVKENINAYYNAFTVCNDPRNLGDITPFVLMMLQMIYEASKELYASLERKLSSWNKYEDLICAFKDSDQRKMRDLYSYLTQAALFSEKGISVAELMKYLNVSDTTARKMLKKVEDKLLVIKQKGHTNYYSLNLQIMDRIILDNA